VLIEAKKPATRKSLPKYRAESAREAPTQADGAREHTVRARQPAAFYRDQCQMDASGREELIS